MTSPSSTLSTVTDMGSVPSTIARSVRAESSERELLSPAPSARRRYVTVGVEVIVSHAILSALVASASCSRTLAISCRRAGGA